MTLQASGQISMGDINVELGLSRTSPAGLGAGGPRDLAGVPSGVIRLGADFYSKSYGALQLGWASLPPTAYSAFGDVGIAELDVTFNTNGTWTIVDVVEAVTLESGNWWSNAPVTGIGNSKYIAWSLDSTSGSSTNTTWTAAQGSYILLSSARQLSVRVSSTGSRNRRANYTVYLSNDGVNAYTSRQIEIYASAIYNP